MIDVWLGTELEGIASFYRAKARGRDDWAPVTGIKTLHLYPEEEGAFPHAQSKYRLAVEIYATYGEELRARSSVPGISVQCLCPPCM